MAYRSTRDDLLIPSRLNFRWTISIRSHQQTSVAARSVAATARGTAANRPCNTQAIRQLLSYGQELLVSTEAHVFVFDVLKSIQELLLIILGQGLVGHRE